MKTAFKLYIIVLALLSTVLKTHVLFLSPSHSLDNLNLFAAILTFLGVLLLLNKLLLRCTNTFSKILISFGAGVAMTGNALFWYTAQMHLCYADSPVFPSLADTVFFCIHQFFTEEPLRFILFGIIFGGCALLCGWNLSRPLRRKAAFSLMMRADKDVRYFSDTILFKYSDLLIKAPSAEAVDFICRRLQDELLELISDSVAISKYQNLPIRPEDKRILTEALSTLHKAENTLSEMLSSIQE